METNQAYCVKCKKKVDIKNPQRVKSKNGKNAVKGECSICGTKVFKFVK